MNTGTYTVHQVPPRGLAGRPLFEVRNTNGVVALTCESRPHAQRWVANLTKGI